MDNHLFCFGLGYSASYLADRLLQEGWRVSGTCRTAEKCDQFRPKGMVTHIFDDELPLLHPEVELASVTHILISIPPGENGGVVLNAHLEDIKPLRHLRWLGYLSTTGVYGDHQGAWVDETTETSPPNERLKRRVAEENAWLDLWREGGLPVHIFRLAGIYGPGRNNLDAVQAGTARRIDKPKQVFSRIHVDDIATILSSSMEKPTPGEVFNCADDLPAPQEEVVAYAAQLLNTTPPPLVSFEEAELSDMARSFYQSNRRVSNQKIKDMLGVELRYPTYKEGLEQLFSEMAA